jgi:hypothetical protein
MPGVFERMAAVLRADGIGRAEGVQQARIGRRQQQARQQRVQVGTRLILWG